jgi:transcriptional regulator with XRE-family HTH domain
VESKDLGRHLRRLRTQSGIGLRELSAKAELSPAALSAIEREQNSPTLATLQKILAALGTSFADFFATRNDLADDSVFPAAEMHSLEDEFRTSTMLFPKRADIQVEMVMETIAPQEAQPEWESHSCDMGGYVIGGGPLALEIEGRPPWQLRKGDAYYLKANTRHRAVNRGKTPVRQVTVWYPPRI